MTEDEDAPDVIEVNRNIDCEIYSASYRRLAGGPAPRMYLTLAFDAVSYNTLCALLGANLKGKAVVHFANVQAPLPDEEEAPEKPEGPIFMRAGNGEVILPHGFAGSEEDALKCTYCGTGVDNAIHSAEAIAADREQARANLAGSSRNGGS